MILPEKGLSSEQVLIVFSSSHEAVGVVFCSPSVHQPDADRQAAV
jgi:hypothetical protein